MRSFEKSTKETAAAWAVIVGNAARVQKAIPKRAGNRLILLTGIARQGAYKKELVLEQPRQS